MSSSASCFRVFHPAILELSSFASLRKLSYRAVSGNVVHELKSAERSAYGAAGDARRMEADKAYLRDSGKRAALARTHAGALWQRLQRQPAGDLALELCAGQKQSAEHPLLFQTAWLRAQAYRFVLFVIRTCSP